MSRRTRRQNSTSGGGWLGRILLVLLALAVLVFGGGYLMLRSYLHSDGFRKFLSNQVSRAADVKGEFSPFRWDGLAVGTDVFDATGGGRLVRLKADGLHTEVGFGGVKRGVWELNGTSVRRLEAFIDADRKSSDPRPPEAKIPETKKERPKRWYPSEVEVRGFEVRHADIEAALAGGRRFAAKGVSLKATAGRGRENYDLEVDRGRLELPGGLVPSIEIERLKARYHERSLFVKSATGTVFEAGRIDASGEWDIDAKTYAFEGNAAGIPCDRLVSESWARRLSGNVSSSFVVQGRPGFSEAKGSLVIGEGGITALPVLDVLAAYADTRKFRVLDLNEARADWKWDRGETVFSNVVLASEGLMRIEGALTVRDGQLDGIFRLGLAQGILATIPGAETDVFVPGENGLLWTTVRISGTSDDPKEDLSERLIAAAGVRLFEEIPGGDKVLKLSRSLLGGDTPEETIRRGIDAIEKGGDAVKEAKDLIEANKDIFKGIFGRGSKKDDE